MIKKKQRILALLTAFMMIGPFMPKQWTEKVYAGEESYEYTECTELSSTYLTDNNYELSAGSYYLSDDLTLSGENNGFGNGLKIKSGDTVVIYLNGYTLSATGKDADDGADGGNGSQATGGNKNEVVSGGVASSGEAKGGYAGILLPSSSTLIFAGEGTVNAIGGDAGNGGNGGNGGSGKIKLDGGTKTASAGAGGAGGQGGGGAGAGIGTNGSNGGNGGNGGNGSSLEIKNEEHKDPNGGKSGTNSSNTEEAGKLIVYSNNGNADSISINLEGGEAGTKGNGGTNDTTYYTILKKGTDKIGYVGASGAGGGGGAAGSEAYGYGAGGVGGAGGTGGGSGGVYGVKNSLSVYVGYNGKGGKATVESNNGEDAKSTITQTTGTYAQNLSKVGTEAFATEVNPTYTFAGTDTTAATAGTQGSEKESITYYLNGVYAKISSGYAVWKSGDFITKDDIEVMLVYTSGDNDELSDTIDTISVDTSKANSGDDGFAYDCKVGGTASDNMKVLPLDKEYWKFSVCSEIEEHSGDHEITMQEVIDMTRTSKSSVTEKIKVKLLPTMFAGAEGFIRDIKIAMDTYETVSKSSGEDLTVQAELGEYPVSGDANAFNEETAIKVITYDNKAHSIASLIKGSGYGLNNDSGNSETITDDFFKKGLNATSSGEYWYSDYAVEPYYQVSYKPFNTFSDYNATNASDIFGDVEKSGDTLAYAETNYLTGSSDAAIELGDDITGKYTDTANTEYGETIVNGDVDEYFAKGQIDKELIKNAGLYTVTVVVPYKYYTYTYTNDNWYGDDYDDDDTNYSYFFHTYTFNIIVREAELDIKEAVDTVYENTKVQSHKFSRYVEGQNDEQVYGLYTYAAAYGEEWGNVENRTANVNTPSFDDIEWEFNIYDEEYIDEEEATVDGRKNLNNYLCQNDGASADKQKTTQADVKNTYYQGNNGVLVYTTENIAERKANMNVIVCYEEHQNSVTSDNVKTPSESLDEKVISTSDKNEKLDSVYAEDIEISAEISTTALGWRVVSGDAVTGDTTFGTKVTGYEDMPTKYRTNEYYNKLISDNMYKGDLYIITIKAGSDVIKTFEYTDKTAQNTTTNIKSTLAKQITDELPACEFYGVSEYDVKVEYIGLYYVTETNKNGRLPGWNGEEEFNWVTSEVNFKLDVAQRDVAIKNQSDIIKNYDGTTELVKQTIEDGDVTEASKYIVELANENVANTRFAKQAETMLYNYIDPTEELTNKMDIELAGKYDDANKGIDKTITIGAARLLDNSEIPESGDEVAALNYHIVDGNGADDGIASISGDIDVAQMHFTHSQYGVITVFDFTPLHEIFNISAKAYLADSITYESEDSEYIDTVTMSLKELVEKNDVKSADNNSFIVSGDNYDYNVVYAINSTTKYKQYLNGTDLGISNETGEITKASSITTNDKNAQNFPAMDVKVTEYPNFYVTPQSETIETSTYNTCTKTSSNSTTASDEYVNHTIRFCITGNSNSYDVLLPINQLNVRGTEYNSKFINRVGTIVHAGIADSEDYYYINVYPNSDNTEFEFTVPQDSYLKDVAIVAMPTYKVYDQSAKMKTYEELLANVNSGENVIGKFTTQAEANGMNNILNDLSMTLDKVNGIAVDDLTASDYFGADVLSGEGYAENKLASANEQIGGSTYKFTLTTGACNLGSNYAIVVVPIIEEFDAKLISSGDLNVSVEKTIISSGDNTLSFVGASDDYVYVNYKTLFDTSAQSGEISMSYGTSNTKTWNLDSKLMNKYYSLAIDTENEATFFDPAKLIPGTEVAVTMNVYRNGIINDMQTTGDADAFDTYVTTWTVSEEDYYRLFKDDTVIIRSSATIETSGELISTTPITSNVIGYMISSTEALNNVSTYITNHSTSTSKKDTNWSVQSNIDLMTKYSKTWKNIDGINMTINENTKTIDGLTLGASIYPYVEKTKTYSGGGSPSVPTYKITVEQGNNGKISPETTKVEKGDSLEFKIKADKGYEIEDVLVDGKSVGAVSKYTFENVKEAHTLTATFKLIEETVELSFVDVNENDWFYDAVKFVTANKLFNGTSEDTFSPYTNMTREMIVTVLYRYAKEAGIDVSVGEYTNILSYDDCFDISSYAVSAMQWACGEGIINGRTDTTLAPQGTVTREEFVTILYRFVKSQGKGFKGMWAFNLDFSDRNQISDWAYEATCWCSMNGIIKGKAENNFDAKATATRAEVATMIMRFLSL